MVVYKCGISVTCSLWVTSNLQSVGNTESNNGGVQVWDISNLQHVDN